MTSKHLLVVLNDDGNSVEIEIRRGESAPVHAKAYTPQSVRIREPLSEKERFLANMQYFADSGLAG
jgi:hypothetical protein